MKKLLTKSNYLAGLQCARLLWVKKNDKQRLPEPDYCAKHNFEVGDMIGVLATKVFPGGVDLAGLGFMENVVKTREAVKNRETIYEAGIMVDRFYSRADVLVPVEFDEWDIVEVKSGTKVKDVNIADVAFQKFVYERAGLKIRNCILMHVNNQYVRDGAIEVDELFVQADVTEEVNLAVKFVGENAERFLKVIDSGEPECKISVNCSDPYECGLRGECWADVPEGSVFEFYRMLKRKCFDLYHDGVICLNDVPEDVKLNDKQKIQRRLAFDEGKHVDKKKIGDFLGKLKYPIYYLDFETINPAIPKFDGMKPYQRIPFQFSLHVQREEGGECEHVSFLAKGVEDCRKDFMEALRDGLGDKGSILVYNQSFEKGVMRECCEALPEFKDWYEGNVEPRVRDLLDVFKGFYYYDSRQCGSASIKAVLPVLSDLSYKDLEIGEGMFASLEYERVTYGELSRSEVAERLGKEEEQVSEEEIKNESEKDRLKVREGLLKYCEMDTLAEVLIVKELNRIVGGE